VNSEHGMMARGVLPMIVVELTVAACGEWSFLIAACAVR
jgi:hypothetical protein